MNLSNYIPCANRTDAQHQMLADAIGVAVDTSSEGIVYPCRVKVADVPEGFEIAASVVVPSRSEANLYYAVAVDPWGATVCACESRKHRTYCRHGRDAQELWTEHVAEPSMDRDDLDMLSAAVVVTPETRASLDEQARAFEGAEKARRAAQALDDLYGSAA